VDFPGSAFIYFFLSFFGFFFSFFCLLFPLAIVFIIKNTGGLYTINSDQYQFFFPGQMFDPEFFFRSRGSGSKFFGINKFNRPARSGVFCSKFRMIMLFNPTLQINRYSGVQSFIGAFEDVEVIHFFKQNTKSTAFPKGI
jgi:hypothetical protein